MSLRLALIILYLLFQIYGGLMMLGIIFSWLGSFDNRLVRAVRKIASWYLGTFEGMIVIGRLDLSPMIALGVYEFILSLLMRVIWI